MYVGPRCSRQHFIPHDAIAQARHDFVNTGIPHVIRLSAQHPNDGVKLTLSRGCVTREGGSERCLLLLRVTDSKRLDENSWRRVR